MTDLIQTRRGFLLGGLALVASPAIVRATSLMPVKCWKTYGPGGVLDIEMITEEMSRLLKSRTAPEISGRIADLFPKIVLNKTIPVNQRFAEVAFSSKDRRLPLEDFSNRILQPMAKTLTRDNGWIISAPPPVGKGVDEEARRNNVRGLSGYFIGTDSFITRFDVLTA